MQRNSLLHQHRLGYRLIIYYVNNIDNAKVSKNDDKYN